MVRVPIYVVHLPEERFPGIGSWIGEIQEMVSNDPAWIGFRIQWIPMQPDHSFRITDVMSRVASETGPVLIFGSAQTKPRQMLKERLSRRTIVMVIEPADSTQLWANLKNVRDLFASGEPFLPRRLVASILIVRKLYHHKYWGGSHNKNFIWGSDLANGRGIDESFKHIAQDVANESSPFLVETLRDS